MGSKNVGSLSKAFRKMVGSRFTPHNFKTDPVDPQIIKECLSITQRAPTSFNTQPYIAVVVTSLQQREALAKAMLGGNGKKVLTAPVSVVFAADLESIKLTPKVVALAEASKAPRGFIRSLPMLIALIGGGQSMPGSLARDTAHILKSGALAAFGLVKPGVLPTINAPEAWAFKNTMLAAMQYMLAASSYGLHTAPMEGFVGADVRKALGIPCRYSIPLVVATGYAADPNQLRTGRFAPSDMFFENRFGQPYEGVRPFALEADELDLDDIDNDSDMDDALDRAVHTETSTANDFKPV